MKISIQSLSNDLVETKSKLNSHLQSYKELFDFVGKLAKKVISLEKRLKSLADAFQYGFDENDKIVSKRGKKRTG